DGCFPPSARVAAACPCVRWQRPRSQELLRRRSAMTSARTTSARRRRPPTAASRGRSRCSTASTSPCASASSRCWTNCRWPTPPRALHSLGDSLDRSDDAAFATFVETIRDWLSARLRRETSDAPRLAQLAEVWEKFNSTARDVEVFNLERKPMVFSVFGSLAE